jgi:cell division transport system permease protein
VTDGWVDELAGSVTVEMGAPDKGDAEATKASAAAVKKLLSRVDTHPAVESARRVGDKELRGLIEPWLGTDLPEGMALPILVDLNLAPGADVQRLVQDVEKLVPGARADTHDDMLGDVKTLVGTARLFILLMTGVIVALAVVSIAGIVRAKFSIHREEVETLHWIGAADEYIAKQFRRHTLKDALKGTMAGLFCMVLTLVAVGAVTQTLDFALLPKLRLMPTEWFLTIVSPVVIGSLIAHLTAQRAVMRELARLP